MSPFFPLVSNQVLAVQGQLKQDGTCWNIVQGEKDMLRASTCDYYLIQKCKTAGFVPYRCWRTVISPVVHSNKILHDGVKTNYASLADKERYRKGIC